MQSKHLKELMSILYTCPYTFYMFGSRITPSAKKFSDIDLFYRDEIPEAVLRQLEEDCEESDLPYRVDFVNYASCDPEFRMILSKKYVIIPNFTNMLKHPVEFASRPHSSDIEFHQPLT